jgi:hypothetical protein
MRDQGQLDTREPGRRVVDEVPATGHPLVTAVPGALTS